MAPASTASPRIILTVVALILIGAGALPFRDFLAASTACRDLCADSRVTTCRTDCDLGTPPLAALPLVVGAFCLVVATAGRRKPMDNRVVAVGAALIVGLPLLIQLSYVTAVRPWFGELDELTQHDPVAAGRKMLTVIAVFASLNACVFVVSGAHLSYAGWKTVRAGRWPYPGMWTWLWMSRTVLDGQAAMRRGYFLIAGGVFAGVVGPVLSWKLYSAIRTLIAGIAS